jgi:isochorismate hydrolase
LALILLIEQSGQSGNRAGEYCLRATIHADPEAVTLDLSRTALIIIDMQRDFLEPGGFGETLGNDVSLLGRAVAPCKAVLAAAREAGLLVIHTRDGHRPEGES